MKKRLVEMLTMQEQLSVNPPVVAERHNVSLMTYHTTQPADYGKTAY